MRYTERGHPGRGVLWSWNDKPKPGAAGDLILAKGGPGHTATGQTAAQRQPQAGQQESGYQSKDAAARPGTGLQVRMRS